MEVSYIIMQAKFKKIAGRVLQDRPLRGRRPRVVMMYYNHTQHVDNAQHAVYYHRGAWWVLHGFAPLLGCSNRAPQGLDLPSLWIFITRSGVGFR